MTTGFRPTIHYVDDRVVARVPCPAPECVICQWMKAEAGEAEHEAMVRAYRAGLGR